MRLRTKSEVKQQLSAMIDFMVEFRYGPGKEVFDGLETGIKEPEKGTFRGMKYVIEESGN